MQMYVHIYTCMYAGYISNIGSSYLPSYLMIGMSTKVASLMGSVNVSDKTQHDNSITKGPNKEFCYKII